MKKYILFAVCCVSFALFANEVATPEVGETWKVILGNIVTVFASALGALAMGLVSLILALISKKLNITVDETVKKKLDSAIVEGIKAAEAWGRNQANKVTPSEKLNYALSVTKTVAGISIVKRFLDQDLVKLIEARLFEGVELEKDPTLTKGFASNMIQSKGYRRVG